MSKIYIEKFLEELEGKENELYLDSVGLPTIGIGHLLTKDELTSGKIPIGEEFIKYRYGMIDKYVYALLRQDLHKYQNTVEVMTTADLGHNQLVALTSFCYNIGLSAFVNSTLLKNLNNGDYDGVPHQMSRWKYAGGKISEGIINRRKKEIEVWETKDD